MGRKPRKPMTYGSGLRELTIKMEEITALCKLEACMIAYGHLYEGKPDFTIFHNSRSRSGTLVQRLNTPGIQEPEKGKEDFPSWDPSLEGYSEKQLQQLLDYLETKSSKVDHKIKFLEQGNAAGESSAIKLNGSGAGESSAIKLNGSGPSNMKYQDKQQGMIADTIAKDSNIVNVHPSRPSDIKEPMTTGDMAANISLADQPSNINAEAARTSTLTYEEIQLLINLGIVDDDYPGSSR